MVTAQITFFLSKYWTGLISLISLSSPVGGNVTLSIKQNHFTMQHSFNLISACFFRPMALVRGDICIYCNVYSITGHCTLLNIHCIFYILSVISSFDCGRTTKLYKHYINVHFQT